MITLYWSDAFLRNVVAIKFYEGCMGGFLRKLRQSPVRNISLNIHNRTHQL